MTLTAVPPDPDAELDREPELTRVTVVVGHLQVDVGLPADVGIAVVADDVIELANAQLATRPEGPSPRLDATSGKWTLARLGGEPFDPQRCLAECNVCDGEVLVIREVGIPCAPMLFDDVDAAVPPSSHDRRPELARATPIVACLGAGLVASVTAALLLAGQGATGAVIAALAIGAAGVAAAARVASRTGSALASPLLAAVAMPLIFAGSLCMVAAGLGANSLAIACAITGFVALLALLTSRRGRPFYAAVIALSLGGLAITAAILLWSPAVRTMGAMVATTSVIVVYLAPRVTIVLSKIPIPPVPTAGEPLDDIETQGGPTVEGVNALGKQVIPTDEGMIERVGPSNQYLTGIVAAATLTAVIGSYLAIDVSNGFFWQGSVFALAVACVLCLRGRTHYDLIQSAALIGGGLLTAMVLIAKTAAHLDEWRVNAALALIVIMALMVACGLIAPRLDFSPVMQRQVEILEYVAIATLFPLCFWIIRLYAFFRELRL